MKQVFRIILYGVSSIVVVAALIYAHMQVLVLWKEVALRQALLLDVPARMSHTAFLKKELDAALIKMQKIHTAIPTRDGLVEVVSAISSAALASGISAQVPVVQAQSADAGEATDAPFSDVRIHVVASGDPAALASFLHRVEHLPYILRVVSWKIDTAAQTTVSSFTSTVPVDAPKVVSLPGSSFEADIAIVTKKKGIVP